MRYCPLLGKSVFSIQATAFYTQFRVDATVHKKTLTTARVSLFLKSPHRQRTQLALHACIAETDMQRFYGSSNNKTGSPLDEDSHQNAKSQVKNERIFCTRNGLYRDLERNFVILYVFRKIFCREKVLSLSVFRLKQSPVYSMPN